MTTEELAALKERVATAEQLNERVLVAKDAIELSEKIDPEIFAAQVAMGVPPDSRDNVG